MSRHGRILMGIACALALAGSAGCGTSDYNQLVNRGVARLRGEVKFEGMYSSVPVTGTNIALRIPMIFVNSFNENSGHPEDGEKIDPARLQPPFLTLPGLKLTYETRHKAGNERLPFYCYIAVTPARPGDGEKMMADIHAKLKQRFPETPDTWETVDADTPDGYAVHWRKLRVTGEQEFLMKTAGQVQPRMLPGVFEIWLHEGETQIVLIGWRSPAQIEGPDDTKFVTVNGLTLPPDNPKPDFARWPALTAGSLKTQEPATP